MTEIRSFRRVFDLERRIYSVDGLRLNPGGVPVRGVVYLIAAVAGAIALSRVPLVGPGFGAVPWYVRELALPAAVATVLAVIRVDGRTFHQAGASQLRLLAGPRRIHALERPSAVGQRWRPPDVVFLPDGSDARLRRLRYKGPGAVLVAVPHERQGAVERHGVGRAKGRTVCLRPRADGRRQPGRRVIYLRPGSRLLVVAAPER